MEYTIGRQSGGGDMRYYLGQLVADFRIKAVFSTILSIISVIENFYGEMLWGFLTLFVLDFITGIMKSKAKNIPISSRRLRSSVTKLGAYMILLTAVIVTSKFEPTFVPLIALLYYYYMFTEFKSILENVSELGLPQLNFLKKKVSKKLEEIEDMADTVDEITSPKKEESSEK